MKTREISSAFKDKLKKTIAAIEAETSVELVVAISPRSDSYTDARLKSGLALGILSTLFLVFSPLVFSEFQAMSIMTLSYITGLLLVEAVPTVKRLLIPEKRKSSYVNRAASTYFLEHNLCATRQRTAVLVYISILERRCKLLGDIGVRAAVPGGDWRDMEAEFERIFGKGDILSGILDTLPGLTDTFAAYLPPGDTNPDELANEIGEDL